MTATRPTSHVVELPSGRFHYLEWGDPAREDALLLLHGFNQSAHSWDEVAPVLSEGRRVIALDQRGHGESCRSPHGDYSRQAMVDDVAHLVTTLGLAPMSLIGMSMGAVHAITCTVQHPEQVTRLVVVDYAPEVERRGIDGIKMMVMRRWPSFEQAVKDTHMFNPRRSADNIRARLEHTMMEQPDGAWTFKVDPAFAAQSRFSEGTETMWDLIKRVRCPSLLVRGGDSELLTADNAERMRDGLGGQLVTIPEAGHSVAGDQPERFAEVVGRFLH